jgi:flagellar hook-associated protein 2
MSLINPLTFTGVSTYSSDLQTILTRAQSIAELPLKALSQDQGEILDKQKSLLSMQSYVGQLRNSLSAIKEAAGSGGLTPTSSSSKVSVSSTGTTQSGQHIITNVSTLATATMTASHSTSATADQTAVTGGGNYLELWVGAEKKTWNLTAGQDNLNSICDWINNSGLGVTASVVSVDSGYLLSVSADATGAKTIGLYTGADKTGSNLLDTLSAGTNLSFTMDGQAVQRSTNTVSDVVDGLQFTFTETTAVAESIKISVENSTQPLKNALTGLVSTYTALQAELSKHIGKAGGALTGDSAITDIRSALSAIGDLATTDGTGLSFDADGTLQLDSSVIDGLSNSARQTLLQTLSSDTGVVAQLGARWDGLADTSAGLLATELDQLETTNTRLTAQMTELTARITVSQERLKAQLQVADTLLATLASQQGMLTATIDSLSYVSFGKSTTKNS